MLERNEWKTLVEIHRALEFPESSISAQLRHLRKTQFGSFQVQKRRRNGSKGTWEYRIFPPGEPVTLSLFHGPIVGARARYRQR